MPVSIEYIIIWCVSIYRSKTHHYGIRRQINNLCKSRNDMACQRSQKGTSTENYLVFITGRGTQIVTPLLQ